MDTVSGSAKRELNALERQIESELSKLSNAHDVILRGLDRLESAV